VNPDLVRDEIGEPVRTWLRRPGRPPLLTFVWKPPAEPLTEEETPPS
jgi:hypothetical protein